MVSGADDRWSQWLGRWSFYDGIITYRSIRDEPPQRRRSDRVGGLGGERVAPHEIEAQDLLDPPRHLLQATSLL
jgi:hypothetical protein